MNPGTIAIVGLGYVGLPLALQFASSGATVIGLEIDAGKVTSLNEGRSHLLRISAATIADLIKQRRFVASLDFSRVRQAEAIIICVPTPLSKQREPDISAILGAGRAIAPHLLPGTLVVLESTSFPGTTDEDLRKVLEEGSGLKAGADFHLAFSPERTDVANPSEVDGGVPKLIGGYSEASAQAALRIYSRVFKHLVPVSSCRVAEAAKLLENIFRSVNIALVNELKVVYASMGIDIWEVIAAARTKPFGFMPFYPGPGLGGHCIPVDPFYLTWKAREYRQHTRLIELAGEINTNMPHYVCRRVTEALNASRKSVNGSTILIMGLAYKSNVDDDRESPSYPLMDLLHERGAHVDYHDEHFPAVPPGSPAFRWQGKTSVPWRKETIASYDAVVIVTDHDSVDYATLADWAQCTVDTRNVMARNKLDGRNVWLA